MKPLRIGFAGASGTGKTWLATRIAEELLLPMCPVGSRQVAAQMGFASPYDADKTPGMRQAFQNELLRQKMAWEKEHASFVSDRTVMDNLTYAALHDVSAIDERMLEITRAHFATYTHVIFCWRSSFQQLGSDPARVLDPTYHAIYEACLQGFIIQLSDSDCVTEFWHLKSSDDTQTGRLSQVHDFISRR